MTRNRMKTKKQDCDFNRVEVGKLTLTCVDYCRKMEDIMF